MDERIQKYFEEELDTLERLKLLRQVEADDELKQQFIEYKNMQVLLSLSHQSDNKEANEQGFRRFNRIIKMKHIRQVICRAASYAAVVAVLMMATYWITVRHYSKTDVAIADNTLYVPAGQRVKITLQDGTGVWLNSKTTLTYPSVFLGKERRVMVDGEAFFEVAGNPEKPFIVSSKGVEMKVLGTKFNVRGYAEDKELRTSLIEGSLQVYLSESAQKSIVLNPNEQVTVSGNSMRVGSIPDSAYFLWTNGIYSFENERLGSILDRLELYYDVKIVVEDSSISEWAYTGKFRQRDGIDEILRIIQRFHKFKIRKDEDNNVINLSIN